MASEIVTSNISECYDDLYKSVDSLQKRGRTALGPALLTAIAIASKGGPGSVVTLCTDGISNIGLGAQPKYAKKQAGSEKGAKMEFDDFYDQVTDYAKKTGVLVNIISIIGEDCDLETLGTVCDSTGGTVDRMKADAMKQALGNVMNAKIIATQVNIKVKIHQGLKFENEDAHDLT